MFARTLKILVNGVVLVVGTACKGPDCLCVYFGDTFNVVARGANVIPAPAPADTSGTAYASFSTLYGA